MAPFEFSQVFLRDISAADDAESGGERLDAVELARLAVVDGVGGDEVGQQARVRRLHPVERRVVQARPTAQTQFTICVCTEIAFLRQDIAGRTDILELKYYGPGEILWLREVCSYFFHVLPRACLNIFG